MPERLVLPRPVRQAPELSQAERQRLERRAYLAVTIRDRTCRAPIIEREFCGRHRLDPCVGRREREHVRPGGGAMGAARVTRADQMLILCYHHHHDGWATSHKDAEREWLASIYPGKASS